MGRQIVGNSYSFLILSMFVLITVFALYVPRFLAPGNFLNILLQSSVVGITAVGMTFVIMTGGIDISVGSVAALMGVLVGKLLVAGVPTTIAVATVLLLGAAIGMINGLAITKLGLIPFVITLAMMAIARGGAYAITLAQPVRPFPVSFQFLGIGHIGMFPVGGLLLVLTFVIASYLLGMTTFGRSVYAVGGNREAARLSGIRVNRTRLWCYVIASTLASLAGITVAARLNTAWATADTGLEFQAITAVIIGGGSLFGAQGNMFGTFLGVLVIGLLNNGLSIMNVSAFQIQAVNGALIFLVVLVDRVRARAALSGP